MPRNRSETFTWRVGDRVQLVFRNRNLSPVEGRITHVDEMRGHPDHRITISWKQRRTTCCYRAASMLDRWVYEEDHDGRQLVLVEAIPPTTQEPNDAP